MTKQKVKPVSILILTNGTEILFHGEVNRLKKIDFKNEKIKKQYEINTEIKTVIYNAKPEQIAALSTKHAKNYEV